MLARKKDVKTSVVIAAIRYKNYHVNYCTQVSIPPKFWDENNMRVRETKQIPEHKTLNEKLISFKAKVSERFLRFKHDNNEMLPEPKALKIMIDNIYRKKDVQVVKTFTFLGYLREMIDQSKKGIRNQESLSQRTQLKLIRLRLLTLKLSKNIEANYYSLMILTWTFMRIINLISLRKSSYLIIPSVKIFKL